MRFSHSIIGSAALAKAFGRIGEEYEKQYLINLQRATLRLHSEAVRGIHKKSSGAEQTRYSPKRTVTASKPGEPPNTDTGTLIKSVGFNIDPNQMVGEVGTSLKYGKYLELGTKDIAPRPWLFPAVEKVKKELIKIFRQAPKHKGVG